MGRRSATIEKRRFFTRPLSAGLLSIAAIMLLLVVLPSIRKEREEAFQEG
jgi:TctA family transporter